MMTTLHKTNEGLVAFSKGAPEVILEHCDYSFENGEVVKLTKTKRDELNRVGEGMSSEALRVLAFAYKETKNKEDKELEEHLVFLGFQGMIDPPRKEVKGALEK